MLLHVLENGNEAAAVEGFDLREASEEQLQGDMVEKGPGLGSE